VTLIICLKNNIHKSDIMIVKKAEKNICTRSISNWASHFNNWRSVKHVLHKWWNNIDKKSDSFFLCLRTRSNVICYYCQKRNQYVSDYIKLINNFNNICIFAVSQSKKENILLKSQHWQNKKQK